MSQIVPFTFHANQVRVINREGEPWFVLSDVCQVLAIGNPSDAAKRLDPEEKGVENVDTLGGKQSATVINESGLYSLIMTSRKPEAKAFKKWVMGEVLPSIRKTGGYGKPVGDIMAQLNDPDTLRGLLLNYSAQVKQLQGTVDAQAPKVAALDRIATATEGALCLRDSAKVLRVSEKALIRLLAASSWIYRRTGKAEWVGYSRPMQQGYLEHKVYTLRNDETGEDRVRTQVLITPKGLAHISRHVQSQLAAPGDLMQPVPTETTSEGGAS